MELGGAGRDGVDGVARRPDLPSHLGIERAPHRGDLLGWGEGFDLVLLAFGRHGGVQRDAGLQRGGELRELFGALLGQQKDVGREDRDALWLEWAAGLGLGCLLR